MYLSPLLVFYAVTLATALDLIIENVQVSHGQLQFLIPKKTLPQGVSTMALPYARQANYFLHDPVQVDLAIGRNVNDLFLASTGVRIIESRGHATLTMSRPTAQGMVPTASVASFQFNIEKEGLNTVVVEMNVR